MDLHNGLDIEISDLRPTDLHYYYYLFICLFTGLLFLCYGRRTI